MNLNGAWFLVKLVCLLPWRILYSLVILRTTTNRAFNLDMFKRVFMRQAFNLADKHSPNEVLNPLFNFVSTQIKKVYKITDSQCQTVSASKTAFDLSPFNSSIKIRSTVESKYEVVYEPENFDSSTDSVLIYIHGGGFAIGILPYVYVYLNQLKKLHPRTMLIISDYNPTSNLKNHHPYPSQLLESIALYNHFKVAKNCKKLSLMGDSSGANLALATLIYLQKCGQELPEKVVLISPWLNPCVMTSDDRKYAEQQSLLDNLSLHGLDIFDKLYLPLKQESSEYLVEPMLNIETNFEPEVWKSILQKTELFITLGEDEILAIQIERFIKKLLELRTPSFTETDNVFVDHNGCHIRPVLSSTSDIKIWSNEAATKPVLNFLEKC